MNKDDAVRLQHMLDAAREAISFAQGLHRTDLDGDRKLILALVKDVEIIGEAPTRFPGPHEAGCLAFLGKTSPAGDTAWSMHILTSTSRSSGRRFKTTFQRLSPNWRVPYPRNRSHKQHTSFVIETDSIKLMLLP